MQRHAMAQATPIDKFSFTSSSTGLVAQETELSLKLHDALAPSLPMHLFMKNVVDVFVLVLQDDGAVFPACLMAASLALADSGVEVYDLVSSFSIAVVSRDNIVWSHDQDDDEDESMLEEVEMEERRGMSKVDDKYHLLADPDANEILRADGTLTVGMMTNWKEVVFWDQTGRLPTEVVSEAVELCKDGCVVMHNFMREALVGQKDRK
jgi:exosome complex component MTR3